VRGTFFAKVSPHTPLQNLCALLRLLAPLGLRANVGLTLSFPPSPAEMTGSKVFGRGHGGEPFGQEGFPPCSFTFQGPEPTNRGKIEMHSKLGSHAFPNLVSRVALQNIHRRGAFHELRGAPAWLL